jgi:phospholipase C
VSQRRGRFAIVGVALAALLAACTSARPATAERVAGGRTGTYLVPPGIHKIKHVIIIMQENRSAATPT